MHNQSSLYREQRDGVFGEGQPAPSPPARGLCSGGLEEHCKLPQQGPWRSPGRQGVFTTCEVLRKTFPDTSVVLFILKTRSHRNALECCQKSLILDPSHCLIQFSIVQDQIVPHFQLISHASRV